METNLKSTNPVATMIVEAVKKHVPAGAEVEMLCEPDGPVFFEAPKRTDEFDSWPQVTVQDVEHGELRYYFCIRLPGSVIRHEDGPHKTEELTREFAETVRGFLSLDNPAALAREMVGQAELPKPGGVAYRNVDQLQRATATGPYHPSNLANQ